jgi:hypothetical protein
MAQQNGTVIREGVTAGMLGALGVAVWFLVVDLIAGQPLYTPAMLGQALLSVLGHGIGHGALFNAAAYSCLHFAVFAIAGIAVSALVDATQRAPATAVGLLLFFVVFETGFYGVAAMLRQSEVIGRLAWYQIGAANLVASALMGWYLWQRHPGLGLTMEKALDGRV